MLFEKLEFMFRGEESKIGKQVKKRKKQQHEQKRRQRLREQAKSEQLTLEVSNDKD